MTFDTDSQPDSAPELQTAVAFIPAPPDRLSRWLRSRPVLGVTLLIIGLLVGYYGRPTLEARMVTLAPRASSSSTGVSGPQQLPQSQAELLPYLVSQTRHWRGNANAPVTLIEFSDFQ